MTKLCVIWAMSCENAEMPEASRSFASDNFAGAHPDVIAALASANVGHAIAYGHDQISLDVYSRFEDLFGVGTKTFFVFAGTGGNVTALSSLAGPGDAVVCTQWSHIHVDETAAPERAGAPGAGGRSVGDDQRQAGMIPQQGVHQGLGSQRLAQGNGMHHDSVRRQVVVAAEALPRFSRARVASFAAVACL